MSKNNNQKDGHEKLEYKTIGDIIELERNLVLEAEQRYGDFYKNASNFNSLLQDFIQEVNPKAFLFVAFLSQVKIHHTLALFSVARRHHIQAMLNMRYVLESGANAAYALANPKQDDFVIVQDDNTLKTSEKLDKKRYQWLDQYFSKGSESIKNLKGNINKSSAHSNLIYLFKNFSISKEEYRFNTPFFDDEVLYHQQHDLWFIANVALGLMDLFYGINKQSNLATFIKDFPKYLLGLEKENIRLKAILMENPRFKKSLEKGEKSYDQNN